jgi:hypothetical protein
VTNAGKWALAFNILVGDSSPNDPSIHVGWNYFAALVIAMIGYFVVPAFIGAAASVIVSVVAVRRITRQRADDEWRKRGPRT